MALGLLAVAAVVMSVRPVLSPRSDGPPVPKGWQLTFEDRFHNGEPLDTSSWVIYSGPTSGGAGEYRSDNVSATDGRLRIGGWGTDGGGVRHTLDQLYGRWEVRARMDKGSGYGPAILLWPQSEQWPADGEIDIAEQPYGDRTDSFFTTHYGDENKVERFDDKAAFDAWHVFAVEWEPGVLRYYRDGKLRYTLKEPPEAIPSKPMHLALQLDVGDNGFIAGRDASTPDVVHFEVDWVRVYKRAG